MAKGKRKKKRAPMISKTEELGPNDRTLLIRRYRKKFPKTDRVIKMSNGRKRRIKGMPATVLLNEKILRDYPHSGVTAQNIYNFDSDVKNGKKSKPVGKSKKTPARAEAQTPETTTPQKSVDLNGMSLEKSQTLFEQMKTAKPTAMPRLFGQFMAEMTTQMDKATEWASKTTVSDLIS